MRKSQSSSIQRPWSSEGVFEIESGAVGCARLGPTLIQRTRARVRFTRMRVQPWAAEALDCF